MALMVSISGIRGIWGDGLDASVVIKYAGAFGKFCMQKAQGKRAMVVVGRDGRITGNLVQALTINTLQSVGCDVIDAGMATTPTVEMAVIATKAQGGIVISASHNPMNWNALKLLNEKGEFLSASEGKRVIELSESPIGAVDVNSLGTCKQEDFLAYHIQQILTLPYIHPEIIAQQEFSIVVDGINSVGGIAIPKLLKSLGIREENIHCINCLPTGVFAHNPEPLPAHLTEIMAVVKEKKATLGIVVDPDADRLAFVADGGEFFGEELTQVVAAEFMMGEKPGAFATNLSSSRTIEDVMEKYQQQVFRSAVGEINVVEKMKAVHAVIGGEGNGGVILPDLHYGRDALVGVALVLQHLSNQHTSLSAIKAQYPRYYISKNKIELTTQNPDAVLVQLQEQFKHEKHTTIDGLKIDFETSWVHLRKSNTEPIIRVYAEAKSQQEADDLAQQILAFVQDNLA